MKAAIERDLSSDDQVISLFYGGSIGTGNTDLYSDIDLRIVVNEEAFEEYRIHKKERAKNWGDVMFYEDFPWASHSVAHYKGFIKVDSFYYTKKDLQPSVWLKDIKIVCDREDFMKGVQRESRKLEYEPSFEEFDLWRNKFFAYTHEVYRGMKREEFFHAANSLESLRFHLTTGWFMESGMQPNNPGYWAKLGGTRSRLHDWQLRFLEESMGGKNPESIMSSLKILVPEFIRIHSVLCKRFGIDEKRAHVEEIFGMVL
ncbi:nucleotidyltransferase domain-containing protein [Bacillus sp. SCS-153A]|uniref:nucleotidyltransferase domain-containing protein n=1 Tax=Rossellomorea sedimentorum TaxID=3115294 RepID=UPI003905A69C